MDGSYLYSCLMAEAIDWLPLCPVLLGALKGLAFLDVCKHFLAGAEAKESDEDR